MTASLHISWVENVIYSHLSINYKDKSLMEQALVLTAFPGFDFEGMINRALSVSLFVP